MSTEAKAGRRRAARALLAIAVVAALPGAGCGEKPEPEVHPPTTATPTTAVPTPTVPVPTTPQPPATTTAPKQP